MRYKGREEIFDRFKDELRVHIRTKEETLYRAMEDGQGRDPILTSRVEHRLGYELLSDMDSRRKGGRV